MTHEPSDYDRRVTTGALGDFGRYLMSQTFDVAVRGTDSVLSGSARAPDAQQLHVRLSDLTEDQQDAVRELTRDAVIEALHGLLHGLSHDEDQIRLLYKGVDVAAESDGLHGDLFFWMRDLSETHYDWEA